MWVSNIKMGWKLSPDYFSRLRTNRTLNLANTIRRVFISNFQNWNSVLPCLVPTWILTSTLLMLQDRRTSSLANIIMTNRLKRVWKFRRSESHACPVASVSSTRKCNCTSTTIWSSEWNIMIVDLYFLLLATCTFQGWCSFHFWASFWFSLPSKGCCMAEKKWI